MRSRTGLCGVVICLVIAVLTTTSALAAAPVDRASVQIDTLDRALASVARTPTVRERTAILAPVVAQTFNVSVMARFVVGPSWSQMASQDQTAVTAALSRYMTARLGHEFATVSNATFAIDPMVQTRGADKVVRTVVSEPGEAPDRLDYRMREYAGVWKVIDIYYNGVSELTTRRADLAATLATGNVTALVARIDATTSGLSR